MSLSERRTVQLGDVADVSWGDTSTTKSAYVPSGFVAYSATGPDGFLPHCDFEQPGIVVSAIGAKAGKTWLASGSWSCIKNTIRVLATSPEVLIEYLYWATREPGAWPIRGSAQPFISQADARAMNLSLPAYEEQKAVVEVLGALEDKIAANERLLTLSEQNLAAEVQLKWLQHGAVPEVSILELFEINPTVPKPLSENPVYLGMKDLPERGSGVSDWQHRPAKSGARFTNGDTLMARITPCLENRKTGYIDFLDEAETGIGSTEFIVVRSRDGIPSQLSYFVAVDPRFRDYAIRHMLGTSGRQRVSASDISNYALPAPDQDWMGSFGERAAEQFGFMKALRGESKTLAKLRDVLLPELMSGRLRVKDAEKQIEEVV